MTGSTSAAKAKALCATCWAEYPKGDYFLHVRTMWHKECVAMRRAKRKEDASGTETESGPTRPRR